MLAVFAKSPTVPPLWLIPLFPLVGAGINLFAGRRLGRWEGWLASATVGAALVLSVWDVRTLLRLPEEIRSFDHHIADWISVGRFSVGADPRPGNDPGRECTAGNATSTERPMLGSTPR